MKMRFVQLILGALALSSSMEGEADVMKEVELSDGVSSHVSGRCSEGFDCDPAGDLICVPLASIRDCISDCPNSADEACAEHEVLCDQFSTQGCGKCVDVELADRQCSDRRWKNLCLEAKHFKCLSTPNCVLPEWVNDGNDDCGDGSDEDPCATALTPSAENHSTKQTDTSFSFTILEKVQKHEGKCSRNEFQCRNGKECVPVHMVLDGTAQCSDSSDEAFCEQPDALTCADPQQECSFNPSIAAFTCGCPIGYHRTVEGICLPATVPLLASDCADMQLQYPNLPSGTYTVCECEHADKRACSLQLHCDMDIFGGGWTIIMQRLNTSLSFERTRAEYEQGFYVDEDNFWIGLDTMQRLTNRCPNELLLRLRTSADQHTILVRYSQLTVCDRLLDYRLNLGPIILDTQLSMSDELSKSRMRPFKTGSELNCSTHQWGWWHTGCDLEGVFTAPNFARDQYRGLRWQGQRLSAIQMLLRNQAYIPPLKPPHTSS